ncbi:hypothetical protein, partial [Klebsiella aerogenes]|uniref:hypothetical protein n=1 Tax=Klebsiella aerogenes TaxID=548 RepID=UPI0013D3ED4C
YLKEKEAGLKDFLEKASGQLKTIGDSIEYSQLQVGEEEANLVTLQERVDTAQLEVAAKRNIFDEQRIGVDTIRNQYQQYQRN